MARSNQVLAQSAVLEWRSDYAWELGLRRHYLG
ncbi:rpoE leader peptide RseD [Pluralibacter gergoviae]|uniref:RpoE leader peptide RseD n=1 Tax=Pluralibacter gergoviae TaxID=61647 RepID=A0AAI9DI60_PLUGE|nr:rpoE leader peptide RseD [Pluralibacter gergoviae]EKV0913877.1 rpoE leader peptide RseD [Pluralibacter gergoviae]EKV0932929.1 rpoE leader peptide RseD [Pluralibacter gergoviae]EKV3544615.1 rpoE leader peptide RseD [Pluralibacter gergoviae]EKV6248899.1 rpoE leader peptide RseD [Pluralibacter gergoviae]